MFSILVFFKGGGEPIYNIYTAGQDVAQLVQHWTKKPNAMLTLWNRTAYCTCTLFANL